MHFNKGYIRQIFVGFIVSLSGLGFGISFSWTGISERYLREDDSPVGPLSDYQISWLGSLPSLGAILGAFIWGPIINKFGRKKTAVMIMFPFIISSSILIFCRSYTLMLFPRFFCGLGISGSILNTPSYLAEISQTQVKSFSSSCLLLMVNSGTLTVFIFGTFFNYHQVNIIITIVPTIIATLILIIMPESPICYLKKGDEEKAKEQLKWLRAIESKEQLESSLAELKESFLNINQQTKAISMSDVIKDSYLTKSLVYGIIIQSSISLSGIGIMTTYQRVFLRLAFKLPESKHSPISILLGSCLFAGAVTSLYVIHNFKRKMTFTIANTAVGLCFLSAAILLYLDETDVFHVDWTVLLGLTCLYMYIHGSSVTSVVYVIIPELFAVECRNKFASILMFVHFSLHFSVNKLYPVLVGYIHLSGWLFIFSSFSLLMGLFGILLMPETKHKTIQEIVKKLSNNKSPEKPKVHETQSDLSIIQ